MKRIILHIGTGKTGTSSIQNFLHLNRAVLRSRHGVDYLDCGRSRMEHFGEVIHAHYPVVAWAAAGAEGDLRRLGAAVRASRAETIVLSCEDFYHRLDAGGIERLCACFAPLVPEALCYVRRQDQYVESAWKQQAKVGEIRNPLAVFVERHTQPQFLDEVHANYHRLLQPWADTIGRERITLRVFDVRQFAGGDLIEDFVTAGRLVDAASLKRLPRPPDANVAIPAELAELLRRVNATGLVGKFDRQDFVGYLRELGGYQDVPLLSMDERRAILRNYAESNRKLFADYLGQEVPECFTIATGASEPRTRPCPPSDDVLARALVAAWRRDRGMLRGVLGAALNRVRGRGLLRWPRARVLEPIRSAVERVRRRASPAQADVNRDVPILDPAGHGLPERRPIEECGRFRLHGFKKVERLSVLPVTQLPVVTMTLHDACATAAHMDQAAHTLSGAIYDRDGRLVAHATDRGPTPFTQSNEAGLAPARIRRARFVPGHTVYLGWFPDHFGHFLLEATARLWALRDAPPGSRFLFHPLNSQVPADALLQREYVRTVLDAFGIAPERIVWGNRDLRFETLTVPSPQFYLNHCADPSWVEVFDRIALHCSKPGRPDDGGADDGTGERLYLSRSRLAAGQRKITNEAEIEAHFRGLGFQVVYPEQVSFAEMVERMSRASIVAGCDGSALHMALFMRPRTTVICLSGRKVFRHQLVVGALRNVVHHFVFAPRGGIPAPDWRESWEADVEVVGSVTRRIVGRLDARRALR